MRTKKRGGASNAILNNKSISKENTIVIYSGRFQPFHKGHKTVYDHLKKNFNHVFIVTTNKNPKPQEKKRYPFSFSEKIEIMTRLAGIDSNDILEVKNPYSDCGIIGHIQAIKASSNSQYKKLDITNLLKIFVVSQKDMEENPRFKFPESGPCYKKDKKTKTKMQLLNLKRKTLSPSFNNINSNKLNHSNHNYIMVLETKNFKVCGQEVNSATQLRRMIDRPPTGKTSYQIIENLYQTKLTDENKDLFDKIISNIHISLQ